MWSRKQSSSRRATSASLLGSIVSAVFLSAVVSCSVSSDPEEGSNGELRVTREEAIATAYEDAAQAYRDMGDYEPVASRSGGNWLVEFRLKDPGLVGGGATYTIDGASGEILHKVYEQ